MNVVERAATHADHDGPCHNEHGREYTARMAVRDDYPYNGGNIDEWEKQTIRMCDELHLLRSEVERLRRILMDLAIEQYVQSRATGANDGS